ncbi:hypothetical protein [Arthrobacter sp. UNC362MFTsu5.1]|uniref:hypothetical protein n=1 Tax=Arthrobacter sp. UNC362MFTsu5.1 TaxID=1449044 RepID=UPI0012DE1085|nr:hypothetical protein [Arthrobacter sp. UNC362MFTsu5.1]
MVAHSCRRPDLLDVESAIEGEDLVIDVDPLDLGEDDVDVAYVGVSLPSKRIVFRMLV